MLRWLLFASVCVLAGCSGGGDEVTELGTTVVRLPDKSVIRAQILTKAEDMMRGMMFRDSLAPDRGMLFIHGSPGRYTYYMFQVKIPLDILWMDRERRIVEISANTPPCYKAKGSECPTYGGQKDAIYVLEIAGGQAEKHGLRVGSLLRF